MKYDIKMTSQFKKDLRAVKKSGRDLDALDKIVKLLANGNKLPPKIVITSFTGNLRERVNVISNRIGF